MLPASFTGLCVPPQAHSPNALEASQKRTPLAPPRQLQACCWPSTQVLIAGEGSKPQAKTPEAMPSTNANLRTTVP